MLGVLNLNMNLHAENCGRRVCPLSKKVQDGEGQTLGTALWSVFFDVKVEHFRASWGGAGPFLTVLAILRTSRGI